MWVTNKQLKLERVGKAFVLMLLALLAVPLQASALTPIPNPAPKPSSYGFEATKTQPPPTEAATITTPGAGASFSTSPITVSGLCKTDLLVQVYDNDVLAGSINCVNGSFSLQVTLFTGQNDISATLFDDLDQAGPKSNVVSVTYNNSSFTAFGELITLTSPYARRAANPGSTLTWPLVLSGGNGPYAFSIDWGDGTPSDLKSQAQAGTINISHVYKSSGLYHVTVKVTDVNGVSAFIQLVAIANGTAVAATSAATKTVSVVTKVVWIPGMVAVVLLFPTYWLGRRSELHSLHRQLEKQMSDFREL
jgi:hypothetical protein